MKNVKELVMKKKLWLMLGCTLLSTSVLAEEPQLITNRKGIFELIPVTETEQKTPVYDLSFVAYDKIFADEFGLVPDYVTDMDEGLRWMEIRMLTEGNTTNCYYTMVLDKAVKLDFPEQNFNPNIHPRPQLRQKKFDTLTNDQKKAPVRLLAINSEGEKYWNRTLIASYDFVRDRSKNEYKGGQTGLIIKYYLQDRAAPYQILSMQGGCALEHYIFDNKESPPSIWIGNDPSINYSALIGIHKGVYARFHIPSKIATSIAPYLTQYYSLTSKQLREEQNHGNHTR